jgi:hypothetical protein
MSQSYWPIVSNGVTSVGVTLPLTSTGGVTPNLAINNFTGDTGTGGLKGTVPAPGAGDAAKFLKASGGWASVPAGGVTNVTGTAPVTSTGGATPAIGCAVFVGDSGAGGVSGLVPAPATGDAATKFLKADGTWGVPAGGGGTISLSGMYIFDGTNYFIGPNFQKATLPVAGSFAWVNQGGATETAVQNALVLSAPFSAGSSNWRIRQQTIGANTVLTVAMLITQELQTFRQSGIVLRESGTGKLILLEVSVQNAGIFLQVGRYSNPTTFNATPFATPIIGIGQLLWLRVAITGGTTLVYSISSDGVNFVAIFSESKTAFMAGGPDQWGYGTDPSSGTTGQSENAYVTLLSFKQV